MPESESGPAMEVLSQLTKQQYVKGIIAMKGLPSTCKTELALRLARWANCPVLCIQDFLGGGGGWADSFEGAKADFAISPPTSTDEIDRRHRTAFTALLNVAHRHLSEGVCNCVVVKSSLNTQYELQLLLHLNRAYYSGRVIIMECKIRNKYLWKRRFEKFSDNYKERWSWSRPRSWKEIEKAMDDDDLPPSWDLNVLHHFIKRIANEDVEHYDYVAWLQVDPFYDLFLSEEGDNAGPLPDEFNDVIKYLLTAPKQELSAQTPYVADYDELRQFLFDRKLRDAARKGRSQSFCEGDCVFKYWPRFPPNYEADLCGICQGEISRKPVYTCYFCVTTLHKTCAERFPIKALQSKIVDLFEDFSDQEYSEPRPCKVCEGGGKEFSKECRTCLLQDRLKCHLLPTIFNHNSHPHFLSIQLHKIDFRCKACGLDYYNVGVRSYGCMKCAFYCHMICAVHPLELKNEHGGHDHVMKLMYTRDGMEEEEDPCWCDCCYKDMDPESWFYSCQLCPYYVVHLECVDGYALHLDDSKMLKFVDQLQSQVDDLRSAGNSIIEPC